MYPVAYAATLRKALPPQYTTSTIIFFMDMKQEPNQTLTEFYSLLKHTYYQAELDNFEVFKPRISVAMTSGEVPRQIVELDKRTS